MPSARSPASATMTSAASPAASPMPTASPAAFAYTGVDGWLASVSTAGSTTRFDYDAVGQITRVTRGDGSWLSYEYDDARRLVAIGNNLGERPRIRRRPRAIAPPSASRTPAAAWLRQQQWA